MREKKYFCELDKWLSEKPLEESWSAVILTIFIVLLIYSLMHFGPEIIFYINGYVEPPMRHKFTMMWVNASCAIILFFTMLKVIRLLRKKPFK